MKFQEIKEKNKVELEKLLAEKKEELRLIRFDLYSKQLKENHRYKKVRKDIARILTQLNLLKK